MLITLRRKVKIESVNLKQITDFKSRYMEYKINDINFLISLDVGDGDPMLKIGKCCGRVRAR